MVDVRSKNLYELLGNDPDLDSDREPDPPTTAVEKPAPRHGKRDPPNEPPATTYGGSGGARGRGGRVTGNEEAFLDREAGSYNNRSRPVEEDQEVQRHGGRGHGDRGGRARNDRHSRTGHTDTNKQIEQGWGSNDGEGFLNDEQAAEAMANTEEIDSSAPPPEIQPGGWGGETTTHGGWGGEATTHGGWGGETTTHGGWGGETSGEGGETTGGQGGETSGGQGGETSGGWGGEASGGWGGEASGGWGGETGGRSGEPGGWGEEEKKSYSEYLAELAEKRREDLGVKAARAPNEGTKPDKKWQSAKEFKRDEDEEQYIKGREDKARRERQRKEKQYLDVDMRFVEPSRGRGNGRGRGRGRGRGGGEGGRGEGGRGEGGRREGGRGDGGRGDGGRGDGGRGDGGRGEGGRWDGGSGDGGQRWGGDGGRWDGGDEPRGGGGRSASGPTVTVDEENFPSLGA